uniref:stalk domain-containing protein n=1 Tax=Tepidibacillus infernus TaxID=1806172 RepID=UPI0009EB1073
MVEQRKRTHRNKYLHKKFLASFLIVAMSLILFINLQSSVFASNTEYYRDRVAVIMYHHIDSNFKSSATITPELFQSQIEYLVEQGYNFISMQQFEDFLYNKESIPINSVLITFDDGYESYYNYAYQILKKYNIPSTNFVIGEWIDKPNGLPRLTSEEMLELSKDPLADLQSHSYGLHRKTSEDHPKPFLTTKLSIDQYIESQSDYEKRIQDDLELNREVIENITNKHVYAFAYPFGAYNQDSVSTLKKVGYQLAFTLRKGMADRRTNPFLVPRINAGNPTITPEKLHEAILASHPANKIVKIQPAKENTLVQPTVYVNGKFVNFPEQKPFINNGLTMVPVRYVSQELQAYVFWDGTTQTITIIKGYEVIELRINDRNVREQDQVITLESPAMLYNGQTMVPLRFISEAFHAKVEWDGTNKTVRIYQ